MPVPASRGTPHALDPDVSRSLGAESSKYPGPEWDRGEGTLGGRGLYSPVPVPSRSAAKRIRHAGLRWPSRQIHTHMLRSVTLFAAMAGAASIGVGEKVPDVTLDYGFPPEKVALGQRHQQPPELVGHLEDPHVDEHRDEIEGHVVAGADETRARPQTRGKGA